MFISDTAKSYRSSGFLNVVDVAIDVLVASTQMGGSAIREFRARTDDLLEVGLGFVVFVRLQGT